MIFIACYWLQNNWTRGPSDAAIVGAIILLCTLWIGLLVWALS